jgi:hypothetical protein
MGCRLLPTRANDVASLVEKLKDADAAGVCTQQMVIYTPRGD